MPGGNPCAMTAPSPSETRPPVRNLFGRIAPRYDRMNDFQSLGLHRWWKHHVVRLANPLPGQLALDLCCGTGDLALRLVEAVCQVVAVDFNREMLEVDRLRAQRPG